MFQQLLRKKVFNTAAYRFKTVGVQDARSAGAAGEIAREAGKAFTAVNK
jgi:hypothetical protein